jgi:hypothetical protein
MEGIHILRMFMLPIIPDFIDHLINYRNLEKGSGNKGESSPHGA